jgi:uncharacterized membrane protein YfcA
MKIELFSFRLQRQEKIDTIRKAEAQRSITQFAHAAQPAHQMVEEIAMITPVMVAVALTMIVTSFLSGIFGMAGGMILMGVLLALLPLPEAMMLHGVTQLTSNGWRAALWVRHVRWRSLLPYLAGGVVALWLWSLTRYVPSKPAALLLLGGMPFALRLVPKDLKPNPESPLQCVLYGAGCIMLILITGIAGPLLNMFFLGGKDFDRKEIVATSAACQVFGHLAKLFYFGSVIDQAAGINPVMALLAIAVTIAGSTLAARVLEKMSDAQFRTWTHRIITGVAGYYVVQGSYLLVVAKTGLSLGF